MAENNAALGLAILALGTGGGSGSSNYALISIPTTSWTDGTYASESCKVNTISLSGAKSGKHPVLAFKPTSISTRDDELESLSLVIAFEEVANGIKVYATDIPSTAFQIAVRGY